MDNRIELELRWNDAEMIAAALQVVIQRKAGEDKTAAAEYAMLGPVRFRFGCPPGMTGRLRLMKEEAEIINDALTAYSSFLSAVSEREKPHITSAIAQAMSFRIWELREVLLDGVEGKEARLSRLL